ncbi:MULTISPECIES: hypothetical protein [Nocardiaceae]|uniref:hypothetical protein n=1 Tax=Nocardiaceae TaxID=85025 RepID=UPI000428FC13|nr:MULTISPECIES: hypothetical protein [Rhodococcus]
MTTIAGIYGTRSSPRGGRPIRVAWMHSRVVYEHAYSGDLTARERKLPVIGGNQMHRLELL